jgi:hypothetical protein
VRGEGRFVTALGLSHDGHENNDDHEPTMALVSCRVFVAFVVMTPALSQS